MDWEEWKVRHANVVHVLDPLYSGRSTVESSFEEVLTVALAISYHDHMGYRARMSHSVQEQGGALDS